MRPTTAGRERITMRRLTPPARRSKWQFFRRPGMPGLRTGRRTPKLSEAVPPPPQNRLQELHARIRELQDASYSMLFWNRIPSHTSIASFIECAVPTAEQVALIRCARVKGKPGEGMTPRRRRKIFRPAGVTTPINRRTATCSIVPARLQTKPATPHPVPMASAPFCHAEAPRPDTGALLAEIGMPSHAIRTYVRLPGRHRV